MRCQFAAKPGKIESSIDLPHQMIFGNRLAKMKLVEQLTLVTLQTAHHGSTSSRFASTQRNHGWRPVSTDFCNKIGYEETSHLLNDSAERPTGPTRMRVIEARRFLSGGLITFDDGLRLLQGRHKFRPGHQCSGLAGLDCATRRNRYGDGSHALDVRHVGDQNSVIIA